MNALRLICVALVFMVVSPFSAMSQETQVSASLWGDASNSATLTGDLPEGDLGVLWVAGPVNHALSEYEPGQLWPVGQAGSKLIVGNFVSDSTGARNQILALDVVSGDRVWAYELKDPIELRAGILIAGDIVLAQTQAEILALGIDSGEVAWTYPVSEINDFQLGLLVQGDTVLSLGDSPDRTNLRALSLITGEALWSAQIAYDAVDHLTLAGEVVTVVAGELDPDGNFIAERIFGFDLASGIELFRIDDDIYANVMFGQPRRTFALGSTLVFARRSETHGRDRLYAYDTGTAQEIWQAQGCPLNQSGYGVIDGQIFCFFGGGAPEQPIYAMDMDSHEFHKIGTLFGYNLGFPVSGDFITFLDNVYTAYDVHTLEPTWSYTLPITPRSHPAGGSAVVGNGIVFLSTRHEEWDEQHPTATLFAVAGTDGEFAQKIPDYPSAALSEDGVAVVRDRTALRAAPSQRGIVVAELPQDTVVQLSGNGEDVDGETWWQVTVTEAEDEELVFLTGYIEATRLRGIFKLSE